MKKYSNRVKLVIFPNFHINKTRNDFSSQIWFMNFFSAHCSHCHQLAPAWRELARQVPEGVAQIGAVNCAEDPGLCQSQRVTHYPSLLLYPRLEWFQGSFAKFMFVFYRHLPYTKNKNSLNFYPHLRCPRNCQPAPISALTTACTSASANWSHCFAHQKAFVGWALPDWRKRGWLSIGGGPVGIWEL